MLLLADTVLLVHLLWIAFVVAGALWTRGRPLWTGLHIAALVWGILVEAGPWPCPLTLAEQFFEVRAGWAAYHGSFLLHALDSTVYPNLPYWAVTVAGVSVCGANLLVYLWRWVGWRRARIAREERRTPHPSRR